MKLSSFLVGMGIRSAIGLTSRDLGCEVVILDEAGNSYKVLAVALDTDGEQLLIKIKV